MRVALVHDFLTQFGGAERVALELSRMFPEAPIFTSLFDKDNTFPEFQTREVVPSIIQGRLNPRFFRAYAPLYPMIFSGFDLKAFDLVLVSSSTFAHHVRHPNCFVYCHTPPRFLYKPEKYALGSLSARSLALVRRPLKTLDIRATRTKRSYAANSLATKYDISRLYGIDARLIYPPLITDHLPSDLSPLPREPSFLIVSRLLPYKGLETAIQAANCLQVPLTIVGEGPERSRLQAIAGKTVEMTGRVSDEAIAALFRRSSAVLSPGVEDFGYGPIEAHWAGRPVVAKAMGGALETIEPGINGIFTSADDTAAWVDALVSVSNIAWDPAKIRSTTSRFAATRFHSSIRDWIGAR